MRLNRFSKLLWRAILAISSCVCLLLPIRKNRALFLSFEGQYSDNPKYVSLRLHERMPEMQIIWVISDQSSEILPDYIKTVRFHSLKHIYYTYCAQIVVDNSFGIRSFRLRDTPLRKFLLKLRCTNRSKQLNVSTWHGTPLKRIGFDWSDSTGMIYGTNTDYIVSGCRHTEKCLKSAYADDLTIKMHGTPRNDILFENVDINMYKEKLKLPKGKNVILFAPTFRHDGYIHDYTLSGPAQMNSLDFNALFAALEQKFGGEWCFVFRVHISLQREIDTASLTEKFGGLIIDGNIGDDMMEYLVCSDILLTDYSSSMFDIALTKKPCFLFAPDREHYENERGFYIELDSLPFPTANSGDELIEQIKQFDEKDYVKKVEALLKDIGNVEDGHATDRIVDDIIYFTKTGEKL